MKTYGGYQEITADQIAHAREADRPTIYHRPDPDAPAPPSVPALPVSRAEVQDAVARDIEYAKEHGWWGV